MAYSLCHVEHICRTSDDNRKNDHNEQPTNQQTNKQTNSRDHNISYDGGIMNDTQGFR